jgi:hypothetical protein
MELIAVAAAVAASIAVPTVFFALPTCQAQDHAQAKRNADRPVKFSVRDTAGRRRRHKELLGRGGTLFFFCGCEPCQKTARQWAEIQRGGALPEDASRKPAATFVFFLGDKTAARSFAMSTGLDARGTAMLPDPKMQVARSMGVQACPRAFVVTPRLGVAYTNREKDDRAEGGSPDVIVSRTIQALRDLKPAGPRDK